MRVVRGGRIECLLFCLLRVRDVFWFRLSLESSRGDYAGSRAGVEALMCF
jgi:hypothetical protein